MAAAVRSKELVVAAKGSAQPKEEGVADEALPMPGGWVQAVGCVRRRAPLIDARAPFFLGRHGSGRHDAERAEDASIAAVGAATTQTAVVQHLTAASHGMFASHASHASHAAARRVALELNECCPIHASPSRKPT